MRKTLILLILVLMFVVSVLHGKPTYNKPKVLSLDLGLMQSFGDEGHKDYRIMLKLNMPHMRYITIALCFQTGDIYHELQEVYYVHKGELYYNLDNWKDNSVGLLIGLDLKPTDKVNPFIMSGIELWGFSFDGEGPLDRSPQNNVKVSSGWRASLPILLGCEVSAIEWMGFAAYIKLDLSLKNNSIILIDEYYYDPVADDHFTTDYHTENIAEWRGLVNLGISFILYISKLIR